MAAIDLNDAAEQRTAQAALSHGYDLDAISDALMVSAAAWVPQIFPHGRISGDRKEIRCANILGLPPKARGSCRIWLTGSKAGEWYDFSLNRGGGQLSTLGESQGGLWGKDLIDFAMQLLERVGASSYLKSGKKAARKASRQTSSDKNVLIANFTIDGCEPSIVGTAAETYLRARGMKRLPATEDLKYHDACTLPDSNQGVPALVARFRYPDGTPSGGIHRIFLEDDGKRYIKKAMLGPVQGAVVMLSPYGGDVLGIAEGIETGLSAMQIYGVPVWACGSDSGIRAFGRNLKETGNAPGIRRLWIFADRGLAGESAAIDCRLDAMEVGIAVDIYLPASDDDFNKDLMDGLPMAPPAQIAASVPEPPAIGVPWPSLPMLPATEVSASTLAALPAPPVSAFGGGGGDGPQDTIAQLRAAISALTKPADGIAVIGLIDAIILARLDPVNEDALFNLIQKKSGIKKMAIIQRAGQTRQAELMKINPNTPTMPWLKELQLNDNGEPKGIMANVAMVLRNHADVANSLGFNEFTGMISVQRKLPGEPNPGTPCEDRPWTDDDELVILEWVQRVAGVHAPRNAVFDAVQRVANENRYHPVRDYLDSIAHDGVSRLDTAASVYLGADNTDYNNIVLKRWLQAAVARIYRPGCKADCMTILEGGQGIGKSTAIRILAGEWFTDQLSEIGTKDSALELRGVWIIEISELDSMTRAESKTIKSYMSRTTDRFRPPYGRMMLTVERQCVFAGSSNDHEFLKDHTGARRFWCLRCGKIDTAALFRDRDQIWAEAVANFKKGGSAAKWWIDEPDLVAEVEQEAAGRFQEDAWQIIIIGWLKHNAKTMVTVPDVLSEALNITDRSKWDKASQMRISNIMRRIGWEKRRALRAGDRDYCYYRPDMLPLDGRIKPIAAAS